MKNKTAKIIREIQRAHKPGGEGMLIVCLNRDCDSMLEDAYLLSAEGRLQQVYYATSIDGDRADEAVIRLTEDGGDLVSFHETRPSSKDRRPNGIRVLHEELDFPCAAFCNTGEERLTVDGEWVEPGGYVVVQEKDINDPEVQKALAAFIASPEVQADIMEVQREYAERMRGKEQA